LRERKKAINGDIICVPANHNGDDDSRKTYRSIANENIPFPKPETNDAEVAK